MGELDGKVAVITGAGSGMANASAKIFVREGRSSPLMSAVGRKKRRTSSART